MNDHKSPTYIPINRIESPTIEEFRRVYDDPQQPIIITGAMRDWKAMSAWSHEWFRSFDRVPVSLSLERTHVTRSKSTTVAEYVNSIINDTSGGHYMDQFSFENIPKLYDYVNTKYAPQKQRKILNLWIGPAGTEISFHKDNHDPFILISNLFAQVSGRKRVLLVSPDYDAAMYPRQFNPDAPNNGEYWHSQVDCTEPDFERFPMFRNVEIMEAILHPGEMLFIPGDYWHSVRSLDKSISVSCWWYTHRLVELAILGLNENRCGGDEKIGIDDAILFGGVPKLISAMNHLESSNPGITTALRSCFQPDLLQLVNSVSADLNLTLPAD